MVAMCCLCASVPERWLFHTTHLGSKQEPLETGTAEKVCLCLLKTCLFWQQKPTHENCHLQ